MNDEIRMTKDNDNNGGKDKGEGNPDLGEPGAAFGEAITDFVLRHSFVLGYFVIGHWRDYVSEAMGQCD